MHSHVVLVKWSHRLQVRAAAAIAGLVLVVVVVAQELLTALEAEQEDFQEPRSQSLSHFITDQAKIA